MIANIDKSLIIQLNELSLELQEFLLKHYHSQATLFDNKVAFEPINFMNANNGAINEPK